MPDSIRDHVPPILGGIDPDEGIGQLLGNRYRLVAPIGAGASARVFLADDLSLGRQVAVKCLRSGLSDDSRFLRRFRAEAKAAAQLSHPNLLAVYDWGEDASAAYLVTEVLLGGSLLDVIDRASALSPSQGLLVALQVAQGLNYAHELGWVHRDIKPANLLFGPEGRLRIGDFGIARAVAEAAWTEPEGILLGTARYAAPEQAEGDAVDGRADVYSLALTIIEAVTGEVPLLGENALATMVLRQDRDVVAGDELGPLGEVLVAAGRADPSLRPTAAELIDTLTRTARSLPRPRRLPLATGEATHGLSASGTATAEPGEPTEEPVAEGAVAVGRLGEPTGEPAEPVAEGAVAVGRLGEPTGEPAEPVADEPSTEGEIIDLRVDPTPQERPLSEARVGLGAEQELSEVAGHHLQSEPELRAQPIRRPPERVGGGRRRALPADEEGPPPEVTIIERPSAFSPREPAGPVGRRRPILEESVATPNRPLADSAPSSDAAAPPERRPGPLPRASTGASWLEKSKLDLTPVDRRPDPDLNAPDATPAGSDPSDRPKADALLESPVDEPDLDEALVERAGPAFEAPPTSAPDPDPPPVEARQRPEATQDDRPQLAGPPSALVVPPAGPGPDGGAATVGFAERLLARWRSRGNERRPDPPRPVRLARLLDDDPGNGPDLTSPDPTRSIGYGGIPGPRSARVRSSELPSTSLGKPLPVERATSVASDHSTETPSTAPTGASPGDAPGGTALTGADAPLEALPEASSPAETAPTDVPPAGDASGEFPLAEAESGEFSSAEAESGEVSPAEPESGEFPLAEAESGEFPLAEAESGEFPLAEAGSGEVSPAEPESGELGLSGAGPTDATPVAAAPPESAPAHPESGPAPAWAAPMGVGPDEDDRSHGSATSPPADALAPTQPASSERPVERSVFAEKTLTDSPPSHARSSSPELDDVVEYPQAADREGSEPRPPWLVMAVLVGLILAVIGVVVAIAVGAEGETQTATVELPDLTQVGDYVGGPLDAVEAEARANNWLLSTTERHDSGREVGDVIEQEPAPGEQLLEGGRLSIVVSLGPELTTVPSVIGRSVEEATEHLRRAGLTVGSVTKADDDAPEGEVLSIAVDGDEPEARLETGTEVDLVISIGPSTQPMPSFVGLTVDQSIAQANELGVRLVQRDGYSERYGDGYVYDTDPPTDAPVKPGDEVTIVVSRGEPSLSIPDVSGLTTSEAASRLTAAGFVVGETQGRSDRPVVATAPAIGEAYRRGTTVSPITGS